MSHPVQNVNRLFRHIRDKRPVHDTVELQRMNVVLDALAESVPQAQQTAVGYFVALMQMVEQWRQSVADAVTVTSVLRLLQILSKKLSKAVFRKHAGRMAEMFHATIDTVDHEFKSAQIMKPLIQCVKVFLSAQSNESWNRTEPISSLFRNLLFLATSTETHSQCNYPAKRAVIEMMLTEHRVTQRSDTESASPNSCFRIAAQQLLQFASEVISECTNKKAQPTIYMLEILYEVLPCLRRASITSICKTLLRLPAMNNNALSQATYRTFNGIFLANNNNSNNDDNDIHADPVANEDVDDEPEDSASAALRGNNSVNIDLTAQDVQHLIRELMSNRPNRANSSNVIAFNRTLTNGAVMLYEMSPSLCHQTIVEVFNTLLDYVHSVTEDVAVVSGNCLSMLIEETTDKDLVQGAKDQYKPKAVRGNSNKKGSNTTIFSSSMIDDDSSDEEGHKNDNESSQPQHPLLRIIDVLESTLSIQFESCLDIVLDVQSTLFSHLGKDALPLMQSILSNVGKLRLLTGFRFQSSLDKTIGSAISACGPQQVLAILPMDLFTLPNADNHEDLSRHWMLPILRNNLQHTSLDYFVKYFVPMANRIISKSKESLDHNHETNAKYFRNLYIQVWSLFPGFCTYPTDFAQSFPKIGPLISDILSGNDPNVKLLISSLPKDDVVASVELAHHISSMRQIVCRGLQRVVSLNKQILSSSLEQDQPNQIAAFDAMNRPHAESTLNTVAKYADQYLPILFNIYRGATQEERNAISQTIVELSSTVGTVKLNEYFKQVLKKILQLSTGKVDVDMENMTEKELLERKLTMMDMATSMIPSLPVESLTLMFKFCKPYLSNIDQLPMQKRSYKALTAIMTSDKFEQFSMMHNDIWSTMFELLSSCHPSCKKYRLQCMEVLVQKLPVPTIEQSLSSLIGELIMARSDLNKSSRKHAESVMSVLVERVRTAGDFDDEDGIIVNPNLVKLFKALMAGLGGTTPTMVSGTVATLTEGFKKYAVQVEPVVADMLSSMVILLRHSSREVLLGTIEFFVAAFSILQAQFLQPYLQDIVNGLLHIITQHKNMEGRPKIQALFQRMIKMFGYEEMRKYFTEKDIRVISSIHKKMKRDASKKDKKKKQKGKKTEDKKGKGEMHDSDDEDWEDVSSDEDDGDLLDLLDPASLSKSHQNAQSKTQRISSSKADASMFKRDKQGKFIIENESDDDETQGSRSGSNKRSVTGSKRGRSEPSGDAEKAFDDYEVDGTEEASDDENKETQKNSTKRQKIGNNSLPMDSYLRRRELENRRQKRRSEKDYMNVTLGQRFRARRGAGDVKKPDAPSPYAYLPMNPSMLNKRNKNKKSSFRKFEEVRKTGNKKRRK